MKISVIIPAYNSENFISETLDCLLSQSLRDIQIVAVDDGSTDGTGKIIKAYAEMHPCILPVYQENSGVSAARNKGIDCAEGEYILFLDSDDLLSENALSELCSALDETQADIALCRAESFGTSCTSNPVVDSLVKDKSIGCYDKRLLWNFIVSNKCYRAKTLKESGVRFPAMGYSEDGAFFMEFIHTVKPKITGVQNAVFRYRRHPGSVTHKVNEGLLSDFARSMDMIYAAAQKNFDGTDAEKQEYLQEILYKNYSALVNEFYRLLWLSDGDASLALMKERFAFLEAKMSDDTKKKCSFLIKDMGRLIFSKDEIREKPVISAVAKKTDKTFIDSVYAQSMPLFEITDSEKAAKGRIILKFKGNERLDSRLFKVIALLKNSSKTGFLPDFLIVLGAKILLKIKK